MRALLSLLVVLAGGLTLVGCPQVQILTVEAPEGDAPALLIHSQVAGLAHVSQRCRVVAELSEWRGTGPTPMVQGVAEPQDVYSEVVRWERAFSGVPAGVMRIRFFYLNELLAERLFEAPEFSQDSLERTLHWSAEASDWPEANERSIERCPRCDAGFPTGAQYCPKCGTPRG